MKRFRLYRQREFREVCYVEGVEAVRGGGEVAVVRARRNEEVEQASAADEQRIQLQLTKNQKDQEQAQGILDRLGFCGCEALSMKRWGWGKITVGAVFAGVSAWAIYSMLLPVTTPETAATWAVIMISSMAVCMHQFLRSLDEKDDFAINVFGPLVVLSLCGTLLGAFLRAKVEMEREAVARTEEQLSVIETPLAEAPVRPATGGS